MGNILRLVKKRFYIFLEIFKKIFLAVFHQNFIKISNKSIFNGLLKTKQSLLVNKQMWHKIPFNLIPSFSKSEKNLAIEEIKKKILYPNYLQIFSILPLFSGVR